jgi:TRAP-type mannitol/chloroaromatic compound transport system substrate-binding protein
MSTMKTSAVQRRQVLGVAAAGLAAPAIVRAQAPALRWRLASSFPKSLNTLYGSAEAFAARVAELTEGRFQIRVFAGGEIVGGLQVLEAVQKNTVEMGQSASYYYSGLHSAFSFDFAVPFGLTSRQQTAWLLEGGGLALMREVFSDFNVVNFPAGNTGAQMGGWFRKEINTLADLKGLKMRIGGLGGTVLKAVGGTPTQIPASDIYSSLERGTIDAAEFVGPYDDEKLGFHKVAKHYYHPAWFEGGGAISIYVNKAEFAKLPKPYQAAIEVASREQISAMQADYDTKNPAALARLLSQGAKLHAFSEPVLKACFNATVDVLDDEAKKSPGFAKIYEAWKRFRQNEIQWFSLAERSFMAGNPAVWKKT